MKRLHCTILAILVLLSGLCADTLAEDDANQELQFERNFDWGTVGAKMLSLKVPPGMNEILEVQVDKNSPDLKMLRERIDMFYSEYRETVLGKNLSFLEEEEAYLQIIQKFWDDTPLLYMWPSTLGDQNMQDFILNNMLRWVGYGCHHRLPENDEISEEEAVQVAKMAIIRRGYASSEEVDSYYIFTDMRGQEEFGEFYWNIYFYKLSYEIDCPYYVRFFVNVEPDTGNVFAIAPEEASG